MKKLFQQTTLTMPELLAQLKDRENSYPRCLLLNEIAAAYNNGLDTPEGDGEKYLLSLLSRRSRSERAIAYCALASTDMNKHKEALSAFEDSFKNHSLMPKIRRMLKD